MIRPLIDDVVLLAIPWDATGYTARGLETYARGSFDPADFVGLPVLYRHGDPVGHVRAAVDTREGIVVFARMASTPLAVEVATLVHDRAVSGVSAGFVEKIPALRSADRKRFVVRSGHPVEVTITPTPAYRQARYLGTNPGAEPTALEAAA
jgi:HK97 family phage prohead protease